MKTAATFLIKLPLAAVLAVGVATVSFVAWFFPWVFTLHLGVLVHFPYEPDGTTRYARLTGPLARAVGADWVPQAHIPEACRKALVASEDAKFFYHNGLDLESMEKSYEANTRRGKIRRGGSTITQQLVKNAFLSRDRSYLRKFREVAGALLLDATLSKESQLVWYFNLVEFGPNVYGLGKAARHYFRKEPAQLSKRECASLVAVLPSPNKWNASLVKKRQTAFFSKRLGTILARMERLASATATPGIAPSLRPVV
jgi:monofunctional biosynthetic peptidoglycan transglycosylase